MSLHLEETPGVYDDLAAYVETIERAGQPDAALRLLKAYHESVRQLRDWPRSGQVYRTTQEALPSDLRTRGLFRPFQDYQLFYRVDPQVIRILAVIHGSIGDDRRRGWLADRL